MDASQQLSKKGQRVKKKKGDAPLDAYQFIESRKDLTILAKALETATAIAVDMEADSMYHYKEKVCLVQVCADNIHAVIDPIKVSDLSPLKKIFAQRGIRKIFHGADYDVRSLYRDFKLTINNLFDTQLASMYLGTRETGLDAVLHQRFGVRLNKAYQKKNWAQRPLPEDMIKYASEDVRYLIPLADMLREELDHKNRLYWVEEECHKLSHVRPAMNNDAPLFLKFKGAGRLKPKQLAILEALLQVRDAIAREKDRPHFKILSNTSLLKIVHETPTTLANLQAMNVISQKQFDMYGRLLVAAVRKTRKNQSDSLPVYPKKKAPRLSPRVPGRIRAIKNYRDKQANRFALDPALLMNKALMSTIAISNPMDISALRTIEEIKKWQIKEFGKDIVFILRGLHNGR
ncbi:MAG: ribonuclease D [Desulfobacteraceae bacterium]|nr:ribonuclease D [Desulfobacteraceae bacterium]